MPQRIDKKIKFLSSEIDGLRSRIGSAGNAVQHAKLDMLEDIRNDYQLSADKALERGQAA